MQYTTCSWNGKIPLASVYDLTYPDAGDNAVMKMKSELMIEIREAINGRYTQHEAAAIMKITQPRVSNLMNGHIDLFSLDELVRLAVRIGLAMSEE